MRKLDYNEYKVSQMTAHLFEDSIGRANFSSPMFIRRFMTSDFPYSFQDKSILFTSSTTDDIIEELNIKYKPSTKKPMYSKNQMYWIGYIYSAISFLYDLSYKSVYKFFPSKEIISYYNIYHTFDIEEAAERMMENIEYTIESNTKRGVEILRKLCFEDKNSNLINRNN